MRRRGTLDTNPPRSLLDCLHPFYQQNFPLRKYWIGRRRIQLKPCWNLAHLVCRGHRDLWKFLESAIRSCVGYCGYSLLSNHCFDLEIGKTFYTKILIREKLNFYGHFINGWLKDTNTKQDTLTHCKTKYLQQFSAPMLPPTYQDFQETLLEHSNFDSHKDNNQKWNL